MSVNVKLDKLRILGLILLLLFIAYASKLLGRSSRWSVVLGHCFCAASFWLKVVVEGWEGI